jgi:hypothetical protein
VSDITTALGGVAAETKFQKAEKVEVARKKSIRESEPTTLVC